MFVTPEDLAAIPADHRLIISRWLMQRAQTIRPSWMLPAENAWAARDFMAGAAVDLVDPTSEDTTIGHAADVTHPDHHGV